MLAQEIGSRAGLCSLTPGRELSVQVVFVAGDVREMLVMHLMVEFANLSAYTAQILVALGDVFSSFARWAPRFYVT
jgi:hypothetical protein